MARKRTLHEQIVYNLLCGCSPETIAAQLDAPLDAVTAKLVEMHAEYAPADDPTICHATASHIEIKTEHLDESIRAIADTIHNLGNWMSTCTEKNRDKWEHLHHSLVILSETTHNLRKVVKTVYMRNN